jgi:hypothetical protein
LKRRFFRRLPLLLAVVLIAWTLLGDRPAEVTLVYDLPTDPPPTAVEIRIVAGDGTTPSSIRWGSGQSSVRNRPSHEVRLAPGTYRLEAELEGADGNRRIIQRPLEIGREDERIVLYLR